MITGIWGMHVVSKRLSMIFTKEEIGRLSINELSKEGIRIVADVHGMSCNQARRFIRNIINAIQIAFRLVIIHGFNHGTAIRDMLCTDFKHEHIANQYIDPWNPGITHMSVVA